MRDLQWERREGEREEEGKGRKDGKKEEKKSKTHQLVILYPPLHVTGATGLRRPVPASVSSHSLTRRKQRDDPPKATRRNRGRTPSGGPI